MALCVCVYIYIYYTLFMDLRKNENLNGRLNQNLKYFAGIGNPLFQGSPSKNDLSKEA
jgi:hypothetical protein